MAKIKRLQLLFLIQKRKGDGGAGVLFFWFTYDICIDIYGKELIFASIRLRHEILRYTTLNGTFNYVYFLLDK